MHEFNVFNPACSAGRYKEKKETAPRGAKALTQSSRWGVPYPPSMSARPASSDGEPWHGRIGPEKFARPFHRLPARWARDSIGHGQASRISAPIRDS